MTDSDDLLGIISDRLKAIDGTFFFKQYINFPQRSIIWKFIPPNFDDESNLKEIYQRIFLYYLQGNNYGVENTPQTELVDSLLKFQTEKQLRDLADLVKSGWVSLAVTAHRNAYTVKNPFTCEEKFMVMGENSSWYSPMSLSERASSGKPLDEMVSKMSKTSDEAIWQIPLHDIEVKLIRQRGMGLLSSAEQNLGLKAPNKIIDIGTGRTPNKLVPYIEEVLNRYSGTYSDSNPLDVYLVDCNGDSLDVAINGDNNVEGLKRMFKGKPIRFHKITHNIEYLRCNEWKEFGDIDPNRTLVTVSGNFIWNVQDKVDYNLDHLPPGVAMVTSHILPEEDYIKLKDGKNTPLLESLREAYSTFEVQTMGFGILRAIFEDKNAIRDFLNSGRACNSDHTMVLYKAIIGGEEDWIATANPRWDLTSQYYSHLNLGDPRLLAQTSEPYWLGILNSLKPLHRQVMGILRDKDIRSVRYVHNDALTDADGNGNGWGSDLVGLYAFRTDNMKRNETNIPNPSLLC